MNVQAVGLRKEVEDLVGEDLKKKDMEEEEEGCGRVEDDIRQL